MFAVPRLEQYVQLQVVTSISLGAGATSLNLTFSQWQDP